MLAAHGDGACDVTCSEFRDEVGVVLGGHRSALQRHHGDAAVNVDLHRSMAAMLLALLTLRLLEAALVLGERCCGAELHSDGMATSYQLGVHQRRRLALLQLDMQLALTRCAHCVRLVGSSRTQLPQLVTTRPTVHVASIRLCTGIVLRAWDRVQRAYRAQGALYVMGGMHVVARPCMQANLRYTIITVILL